MKYKSKIAISILLFFILIIVATSIIYFIQKNILTYQKMNITMVIKSMDPSFNFWQIVKAGAVSAKNEYGINLNITGPWLESNINDQKSILEKLIIEKPSAIILAALDYNALTPVVEKIHLNGIPIITIDSGINSNIPISLIATDNIVAGQKLGKQMIKLLSSGDSVAILSYVKGTSSAIEREKGVRKALGESEKLIIEGSYYCDNFREKAIEITLDIVKNKPQVKGIIALNDPSTTGAARALKKIGDKDLITLIGFDNGIEEIEFLEEGIIKALVVQKPFNMGYLSVKTAIEMLRKKKVNARIDTGSTLITLDNMYTQENQKLLFPLAKEIPIK